MRKLNWIAFVNSDEGKAIIILDELGYKLTSLQKDLTPLQEAFLLKGYAKLQEERNKAIEDEMNKR